MAPITVAQRSRQLLKAIKEDRLDVVTRLLAEGVDLEFEDRQGLTALRSAALEGNVEVMKCLLAAGADREGVTEKRSSPLISAAMMGNFEAVQLLLEAGADAKRQTECCFQSPLYWAIRGDYVEIVKLLLEAGADVHFTRSLDESALRSIGGGPRSLEMLKVLIAAGAPWDVSEARNGITLLIHFARMGNTDVLRHLLELGANIDASEWRGKTALSCAAESGRVEAVRVLIGAGAALEQADRERATPLFMAAIEGRLEVVKLLVESGADLAKAAEGSTHEFSTHVNLQAQVQRIFREQGLAERLQLQKDLKVMKGRGKKFLLELEALTRAQPSSEDTGGGQPGGASNKRQRTA